MGTNLDTFLCDLARSLRQRADRMAAQLVESKRIHTPTIWEYDDLAALAALEVHEHVALMLDVLESGRGVADATVPPTAVEFARRVAERGIPISELLRTYRIAHAGALQTALEEVARLTRDAELRTAAGVELVQLTFDYVDRASEQVVAVYQEARDRRLQRRLLVINEASRRIGGTLDAVRTARELAEVGADQLADLVTVDLLDSALQEQIHAHPEPEAFVLHRVARKSASGGRPDPPAVGTVYRLPDGSEPARAMAQGRPVRYAMTSSDLPEWAARPFADSNDMGTSRIHSILLAPLWAHDGPLGLAQFVRHQTHAPFDDDDLLLAQEIASRAAVHIDNARQFARERSTALTLQHSLLPRHVPQHSAVETAVRYLPCEARAEVGGDWYDVIPLSGGRVALVVGDVVGRGLRASATMGRLRTAVRTLADIDLMPDELLTHLDDVVIRLQKEEEQGTDETSATCLYAVYDPVSRVCSMASAGHLVPAVVTPAGVSDGLAVSRRAHFPELRVGPPLGLGGLPFEMSQFQLPEGSLLALYTDGLIESRTRDVDTGLDLLRHVLEEASTELEDTCDQLLSELRPVRSPDDVALLVARTRVLDADHVLTLDLPSDPEIVAQARACAVGQLTSWGLVEMAFATELIVSELVTNAIRYGRPPIQLRLILESTLIVEVSDSSSTAPHLRRARVFDEGGRGLLLVAKIAGHWGTRHTREGKVIWAETSLLTGDRSAEAAAVRA
ncbi:SpoIIE family protein phosphatase [Streptomyces sp. NBC_00076]|uniref:ATP-binding SpoIIE family protein phosphatase n=1 Tax=Streptomyces sp. NBC_00076 TaxID=2975642 RepID=UPI00324D1786